MKSFLFNCQPIQLFHFCLSFVQSTAIGVWRQVYTIQRAASRMIVIILILEQPNLFFFQFIVTFKMYRLTIQFCKRLSVAVCAVPACINGGFCSEPPNKCRCVEPYVGVGCSQNKLGQSALNYDRNKLDQSAYVHRCYNIVFFAYHLILSVLMLK